jgi:hypothetical protein
MPLRMVLLGCLVLTPVSGVSAAPPDGPAAAGAASSVPSPAGTAPTRRLRVTGRFDRSIGLTAHWEHYSKELALPWFADPAVAGAVLLFASRVSDVPGHYLAMAPQQPVCWCAPGKCTSLKVSSVQGECGRLENPGDGNWERHLSGSQWKTLGYTDTFVALNLELPPTVTAVELSFLANRCAKGGSFMFPITSTHTDTKPGSPIPVYLSFSPHGSSDFTATIEVRLLSDGAGAFDVEVTGVKMDDRDPASRARAEECVAQHRGSECRYASLEPDLDGVLAGVANGDLKHCQ